MCSWCDGWVGRFVVMVVLFLMIMIFLLFAVCWEFEIQK